MKASPQHLSSVDTTATAIADDTAIPVSATVISDASEQVTPTVVDSPDSQPVESRNPPPANAGSALARTGGSFSTFLAPLKKDTFKQVVNDVEEKLKTVNQTLSMLDNLLDSQGFDAILDEMLRSITLKTGELLNADRTTIFLLDEEKNELFTLVAKDEKGNALEIRLPADKGIAGEVATWKRIVNIPYDFYNDPRSEAAKAFDKKNHYRTYTMLTMPLLNEQTGALVAVVQLINKLKADASPLDALEDKIDQAGFTTEDEQVFTEFAPSIRLILESSKSFYAATQKQRAATALMNAVNALAKSSLDLEETLKRVMDQAKELMNADRSTLWLLDEERNQLWTKIPIKGKLTELRIARNEGFAGIVAETGGPLMIPFDLYEDPRSEKSRETDQRSGYRTCSMLCMPVFNADGKLIGVTQLINKKKQGDFAAYNPENWPDAPEQWKASFNRADQEFMQAFNIQAGVALQNAKLFAEVKRQEQMQKDILRSLTNGVISTDRDGHIIAANECAIGLLGLCRDEPLEGKTLRDLIQLKEGDFAKWFDAALSPKEDKDRQQYYPDRTLLSLQSEEHSVNLSIVSMADVINRDKVIGALVVIEDISGEKQVKNLMYRYMTPEVAESLLASGDVGLGGKRKHVSVLFSDIRSYTSLTEKMQAEEVVAMLNAYFEEMVDAVLHFGGTLDKYIGDALMAVFGSPAPLEDHSWCAMQTAIAMRYRLQEFNDHRRAEGKMAISIGIGIHSDEVVSGNIGSSKRMELTSIGDGVNLASRLEGTSKQYGTDIVISESTYKAYADRVIVRELDLITVKGKSQPVRIYELVGLREGDLVRPLSEQQQEIIKRYHQGREYYLKPALEKLTVRDLVALLQTLEDLSESEIKQVTYDDKQMLRKFLSQLKVSQFAAIVGEKAAKRVLEVENFSEITDSEAHDRLPGKLEELTPSQVKQLLQAKLQQFTTSEAAKQMLEEEVEKLPLARLKKLLDLTKKLFIEKSKEVLHQAKLEFEAVLALDPHNKAAKLHIERCLLYEQEPPDESWDGVWKLTEK